MISINIKQTYNDAVEHFKNKPSRDQADINSTITQTELMNNWKLYYTSNYAFNKLYYSVMRGYIEEVTQSDADEMISFYIKIVAAYNVINKELPEVTHMICFHGAILREMLYLKNYIDVKTLDEYHEPSSKMLQENVTRGNFKMHMMTYLNLKKHKKILLNSRSSIFIGLHNQMIVVIPLYVALLMGDSPFSDEEYQEAYKIISPFNKKYGFFVPGPAPMHILEYAVLRNHNDTIKRFIHTESRVRLTYNSIYRNRRTELLKMYDDRVANPPIYERPYENYSLHSPEVKLAYIRIVKKLKNKIKNYLFVIDVEKTERIIRRVHYYYINMRLQVTNVDDAIEAFEKEDELLKKIGGNPLLVTSADLVDKMKQTATVSPELVSKLRKWICKNPTKEKEVIVISDDEDNKRKRDDIEPSPNKKVKAIGSDSSDSSEPIKMRMKKMQPLNSNVVLNAPVKKIIDYMNNVRHLKTILNFNIDCVKKIMDKITEHDVHNWGYLNNNLKLIKSSNRTELAKYSKKK